MRTAAEGRGLTTGRGIRVDRALVAAVGAIVLSGPRPGGPAVTSHSIGKAGTVVFDSVVGSP